MHKTKFSTVMAAALLGIHLSGSAFASVTESDLFAAQTLIEAGNIQELLNFLRLNPELLLLKGVFGAALREFAASPSPMTLARVQAVDGDPTVMRAAQLSGDAGLGSSIY